MSDGDLRAQAEAIKAETDRRASEDVAVRNQRLRQELAEVKAGTRPARREHIQQMAPAEISKLLEDGHLEHLGFGARRRRQQR
jgi:hypothetical protein